MPLDDQRQWCRYHHLFADVLQARLIEEQPDRVAEDLDWRASDVHRKMICRPRRSITRCRAKTLIAPRT